MSHTVELGFRSTNSTLRSSHYESREINIPCTAKSSLSGTELTRHHHALTAPSLDSIPSFLRKQPKLTWQWVAVAAYPCMNYPPQREAGRDRATFQMQTRATRKRGTGSRHWLSDMAGLAQSQIAERSRVRLGSTFRMWNSCFCYSRLRGLWRPRCRSSSTPSVRRHFTWGCWPW